MLTLNYQSIQRGPVYFFHVESSVKFLSKNLTVIAYRREEKALEDNFTHVTAHLLSTIPFVPGMIFQSALKPGVHVLSVKFNDQETCLLKNQDITISLLTNWHGDFLAIAHFHAHVDHSDVVICSPDLKNSNKLASMEPFRQCKFDTLTFEQVGEIVQFPDKPKSNIGKNKNAHKQPYPNVEEHDVEDEFKLKCKKVQSPSETPVKIQDVSLLLDAACGKPSKKAKREVKNAFDLTPILNNSFDEIEGECLFPVDVFEKDGAEAVALPKKN